MDIHKIIIFHDQTFIQSDFLVLSTRTGSIVEDVSCAVITISVMPSLPDVASSVGSIAVVVVPEYVDDIVADSVEER